MHALPPPPNARSRTRPHPPTPTHPRAPVQLERHFATPEASDLLRELCVEYPAAGEQLDFEQMSNLLQQMGGDALEASEGEGEEGGEGDGAWVWV
jgi:hypothetical protein